MMEEKIESIDKGLFAPLPQEEKSNQASRPSQTYWSDAWRRLKQNKVAMVSLYLLIFLIIISIVGPFFSKYTYRSTDTAHTNMDPSLQHLFGTDQLGRDLYVRTLYGIRISMAVGVVSALINFIIGVIYGGVSGYYGGTVDNIMMRIVDIIYSIPTTLYVILLMVVFGEPKLTNVFIALGISLWVNMARIVRGQILTLKQQEFVLAAKGLGAGDRRIILRHLIPNCMGPIIVTLTMTIPSAIFTEAFLSYIGLGVAAPLASLGVLCNDATKTLGVYPFQMFFPALAICLIMLTFNLLGDGLRDALDPKMRK